MKQAIKGLVLGLTASLCLLLSAARVSADISLANNFGIQIEQFTTSDGETIYESLDGLAIDGSGNLYVAVPSLADAHLGTIVKFDTNGSNFVFASGLTDPGGLAFDKSGNLYVTESDISDPDIMKVDLDGNVSVFAPTQSGGDYGIAVDSNGNVYVASFYHRRIYKYDQNGNASLFALFGSVQLLSGLAIDQSGNIYAASNSGTIGKFDSSGNETNFAVGLFGNPSGLAFDAQGNLYAADFGSPIEEFSPTGSESLFSNLGFSYGPQFIAIQVPEPSAWSLAAIGFLILGVWRFLPAIYGTMA